MRITTHTNPYSNESFLKVTITIGRNEAVSFSEVASEVSRAVAQAKDPADRRVYPKGYLGEDEDESR